MTITADGVADILRLIDQYGDLRQSEPIEAECGSPTRADEIRAEANSLRHDIETALLRLVDPRTTETRTEWTTRIHYTDGRPHADGQPMSCEKVTRMAADGLNQVENTGYRARKNINRSEPVRRNVHTTGDGWMHTGPWQVVDNASEVGLIGRAHAAALPAGPFDGWVECQVAGCPSTSSDMAAEDEMDDADGMAHGVQHHHLIDHWVVRETDVRNADKEA